MLAQDDTQPVSPRLQQLRAELDGGDADEPARFWAEVAAAGSPLIERLPDDPAACLVTFLWRETEPIENVVVVEELGERDPTLQSKRMTKLAGSDVWFRTLRLRSDLLGSYQLLTNDTFRNLRQDPDAESRYARMQRDPLNPHGIVPDHPVLGDITDWEHETALVLPDAPALPGIRPRADAPHGEVRETRFASAIMGAEYRLWIHLPADDPGDAAPHRLLLQVDGEWCVGMLDLPWLLDSLLADGAIPPLVTVLIDTPNREGDLPCNPAFADFLADELIPHLRETFAMAEGPQSVIAAGQSYGGLAAAWVALKRPDAIGNAFCQSGAFWWGPGHVDGPDAPEPERGADFAWLPGYVARAPLADVRFWLEAGVLEDRPYKRVPSLLSSNRHLRDVLLAKGYNVAYREFPAGHDFHVWRGLYPDGLIHLTRDAG
ncbi:MAG: alpha/beta hydrolase-fold protein [Thermomicrobiales bacterium]